jgi:hypothetical protein
MQPTSETVKISVGGKLFETTKTTLNASGYFAAYFRFKPKTDTNDVHFIDRDRM